MARESSAAVSPRARRLAERIHVLVAQLLDTRVKDPRLGFVTVTDVRVSGDLQHASVFYTVMGDQASQADTAAALRSATGLLRSEVGAQLGMRLTPTLEFIVDALPDTAAHVEDLLAQAKAHDEQVRQAARQARPAGEDDPYRKPRQEEGEVSPSGGTGA